MLSTLPILPSTGGLSQASINMLVYATLSDAGAVIYWGKLYQLANGAFGIEMILDLLSAQHVLSRLCDSYQNH